MQCSIVYKRKMLNYFVQESFSGPAQWYFSNGIKNWYMFLSFQHIFLTLPSSNTVADHQRRTCRIQQGPQTPPNYPLVLLYQNFNLLNLVHLCLRHTHPLRMHVKPPLTETFLGCRYFHQCIGYRVTDSLFGEHSTFLVSDNSYGHVQSDCTTGPSPSWREQNIETPQSNKSYLKLIY